MIHLPLLNTTGIQKRKEEKKRKETGAKTKLITYAQNDPSSLKYCIAKNTSGRTEGSITIS